MTTESLRVLAIRHHACTHLGALRRVLQEQNASVHYLDTPEGMTLTDSLKDYSHIVVLGGGFSAYEDEQYPFLRYELRLLERAIAQHLPILGICLGSQLLARVLGANVYRGQAGREAGWCNLRLTEMGKLDPLLKEFPQQFRIFQSHQDTFDIPPDCVHLVYSDMYPNQAFRYRDHVWAIQFHPEIDDQLLSDCAALIDKELTDSKIEDTTVEQLVAEASYHTPIVAPLADAMMRGFLQVQSVAYAGA